MHIRAETILLAVEEYCGINPRDFCRQSPFIHARHLAIWALREIGEFSYAYIAGIMGYADPTSIYHHLQRPPNWTELRMVIQIISNDQS